MLALTIDIGNSRTKIGTFSDGKLIETETFASVNESLGYISSTNAECAIICQVGSKSEDVVAELRKRLKSIFVFSCDCRMSLTIDYATPHTLGLDRVAAALGAWSYNPYEHTLVVDAGTALTYDLVSANGIYHGGNIAPGVSLRYKALSEHTSALPLGFQHGCTPCFGKSTEQAIRCGVEAGVLAELIFWYNNALTELHTQRINVLITGGEGKIIASMCPPNIGARYVPDLVHKGLYEALSLNIAKQ